MGEHSEISLDKKGRFALRIIVGWQGSFLDASSVEPSINASCSSQIEWCPLMVGALTNHFAKQIN